MLKKAANGLEVAVLPDETRAILPTVHLSDHMSNCPLLWESLQEGDIISDLICFNRKKQNIVSCLKVCWFILNVNLLPSLMINCV